MVRIKKKQTATRKRKYRINETNPTNSPKQENLDGSASLNETSDSCPSNNNQVLKKIFGNNESFDRVIKNSTPLLVEESSKKPGEVEHRINV
ncbi:unnamed protein product [Adineta ricciae]|uniref:Uncharacterized protein n=1 Tax=Adineta ricciae TaxID=249248 RepID=A0A813SNJ9_ADIRI|nr:unnamed protein product [Adineta ricciae]